MSKTLPQGWRRVRLGEVLERVNRFEKVKPDQEYRLLGVRWYAQGVFERERKLGKSIAAKQLNRVEEGDFVYNRLFAWKGSFAVVGNDHAGGYVSGEFPVFQAKRDEILAEFLYRHFSTAQVWKLIEHHSTGTTNVSRNRWREEQFLSRHIALPPVSEQERIVATLRAMDYAIDGNEEVIGRTEEFIKVLSHELLTHGLPGCHADFKDSPVGKIPSAWEVKTLGQVLAHIEAGKSPKCEDRSAGLDEWGILKVSSVSWNRFLPEQNKALPKTFDPMIELEVRSGDLLVSRANTPELVGRSVVVGRTRRWLMLSDKTLRLVPNRALALPEFLNLVFGSKCVRAQIEEGATGSSRSMKNISQDALRQLVIPIPPVPEQEGIVAIVKSLNVTKDPARQLVKLSMKLRSALRNSLLRGQTGGRI